MRRIASDLLWCRTLHLFVVDLVRPRVHAAVKDLQLHPQGLILLYFIELFQFSRQRVEHGVLFFVAMRVQPRVHLSLSAGRLDDIEVDAFHELVLAVRVSIGIRIFGGCVHVQPFVDVGRSREHFGVYLLIWRIRFR